MKEESRIVELLAELLQRPDRHDELIEKLVEGQNKLVEGQNKLVEGQNKTNLALGELRLSNMRMVEILENNLKFEHRIKKLEMTVFKKTG